MTATLNLDRRADRCPHGWHIPTQGCVTCAENLKERGQAIAEAAHPTERAKVEAAIRQLAASGRPFSANDARKIHGVKGGVVGAAFTAMKNAGVIKACGDVTSNEPGTHGHRVYRWIGGAQ